VTVVAVVGVANAIKRMNGMDGLASSIALVAMAWYALVAAETGLAVQTVTAMLLCGAIAGLFALDWRLRQRRARVFLGDAGSLMVGSRSRGAPSTSRRGRAGHSLPSPRCGC
jgi:UDP-GlcNAc:undecaprenyl-phosphate/decaprenyl-phosphate GlcNAc-1-phosphate transferase